MPEVPNEVRAALAAANDLLRGDVLAPWPTKSDDVAAVDAVRARLERRYALAVAGEFSSGKSYLLNALIGKTHLDAQGRIAGLLATDINPSTATITELEYGSPERATARFPSGRVEQVPIDGLARFVAVGKDAPGSLHDSTADDDSAPAFVTVELESSFLRSGFTIADTPGLASLNPAHRRATLGYLPRTDAVLYLIDTQQPFTEGDASFLGIIGEHVRTIFIVQTKIDLWRQVESDGRTAWAAARARIVEKAAQFAPGAEVYSVSARDFAAGTLEDDEALREASGFPSLIAGLERSLDARVRAARVERAIAVLGELHAKATARLQRESELAAWDAVALAAERERAATQLGARETALERERDGVRAAGDLQRERIEARAADLAERAGRALGSAIDVADIARIRDRSRFHALVDAALVPVWTAFGGELGSEVASALAAVEAGRGDLRVADLAALRFEGEPGSGAWTRDVRSGIASTVVLGAVGGPTLDFVTRVAGAFASHPHGTYMKRELGADLTATFLPALARDVGAFVSDLGERVRGIYHDVAQAIERERSTARAETLDPIDRALRLAREPNGHEGETLRLSQATTGLERLASAIGAAAAGASAARTNVALATAARAERDEAASFDPHAYDLGLVPTRYRIVVLGALRRGKTSFINAIAGTRLLQDDAANEARFPIHVRFGERARAYELTAAGAWNEIGLDGAIDAAARTPVLVETPWSMPKQLVLVHAPAFDSGNEEAEDVALAAAGAASEIVALFSRQLSDRELEFYARAAQSGVPFSLVHTIADNESAAERRTVVTLAERYARERGVAVSRVYTISALDYMDAMRERRPPAAWNELVALRETLGAHAEEHMRRLADRERRAQGAARSANERAAVRPEGAKEPGFVRSIARLFGRRTETK